MNVFRGYAAAGWLYITTGPHAVADTLLRLDPRTLSIAARRNLGEAIEAMLLAGGALWVETAGYPTRANPAPLARLVRLNPRSLSPESVTTLGPWPTSGDGGAVARAGGWLWVAGADDLDRVSPVSGRVTRAIPIGPVGLDLAASPDQHLLLLSAGNSGSRIERRDPHTGKLLASSPLIDGVIEPRIGGTIDGDAWFSVPTGMMGYVSKLNLRSMRYIVGREGFPGLHGGTNGVQVDVIDGLVWISQLAGGRQSNYCADPRTGRPRATLAVGPETGFLTADNRYVYTDTALEHGWRLTRLAIPARCR